MSERVINADVQIRRDVEDELTWDTRVKVTDVGVGVNAGVVTLTGTVNSWAARIAVQEAAHRVSGVLEVANAIRVVLPGSHLRTDADIARAARRALEWDVFVPDERVRTTMTNGAVTLEGKVDCWSQYDDAARCVRNLAGVVEVRNLISVEPPSSAVATITVRSAIERALERHAEHAAKHVHIAITDGTVTLSGAVPSWAERNAIEGAVRGNPGVRAIESQIRIEQ
jgi:osmotically-inducible protein OsmY